MDGAVWERLANTKGSFLYKALAKARNDVVEQRNMQKYFKDQKKLEEEKAMVEKRENPKVGEIWTNTEGKVVRVICAPQVAVECVSCLDVEYNTLTVPLKVFMLNYAMVHQVHWDRAIATKGETSTLLEKRENPKVGEVWQRHDGSIFKIIHAPSNAISCVHYLDVEGKISMVSSKVFMGVVFGFDQIAGVPNFKKVPQVYWDRAMACCSVACCEMARLTPAEGSLKMALTENVLSKSEGAEKCIVKAGEIYRHHGGSIYRIKAVDKDSEDPRILRVSYEDATGDGHSRTLRKFVEHIYKRDYRGPRFTLVDYTEWEKACNEVERLKKAEELKQKEDQINKVLQDIKVDLMESADWRVRCTERQDVASWINTQKTYTIIIEKSREGVGHGSTTEA